MGLRVRYFFKPVSPGPFVGNFGAGEALRGRRIGIIWEFPKTGDPNIVP